MPDDDVVPGRVRYPYRAAFRGALDGWSDRLVGDLARKSLPRDLRDSGGCAGITELGRAARDLAVFNDESDWARSTSEFLEANRHSPVAQAILRQAEAMVGTEPEALQGASDEHICQQLAEGGLERHLREGLFAREREQLVQQFGSYEDARDYEDRVIASAGIPDTAASLLRHPDGVGLRAPNSQIEKAPMSELLEINLAATEEAN